MGFRDRLRRLLHRAERLLGIEPTPPQPPPPVAAPSAPKRPRTRRGRARQALENELREARQEIAYLERERARAEHADELEARSLARAEARQRRRQARLTTYPRRIRGRAPRMSWGEENRRLQSRDLELLQRKYDELRRAGVPAASLAIVQVEEDLWDLIVTTS